jgi:hypothetical protein
LFAAVPLIAGATIVLTTASVWAFSQQTLAPSGNYNFNYSGPDDKAKFGESPNKSDSNSPGFHFSIERGQTGPFGFHSFGEQVTTMRRFRTISLDRSATVTEFTV